MKATPFTIAEISTATRKSPDDALQAIRKGVETGLYVVSGRDHYQLSPAKLKVYKDLEEKMVARFSELKKYGFVTEKDDDSVEIGKKISRLRLLEEDGEKSRGGFPGTGD